MRIVGQIIFFRIPNAVGPCIFPFPTHSRHEVPLCDVYALWPFRYSIGASLSNIWRKNTAGHSWDFRWGTVLDDYKRAIIVGPAQLTRTWHRQVISPESNQVSFESSTQNSEAATYVRCKVSKNVSSALGSGLISTRASPAQVSDSSLEHKKESL